MEEAQEHRGGPENMDLHMCMYVTATAESHHWFLASFEGAKSTGELMLVEADAEPEEDAKQLPKRRALSDELWPGSSMRRIPQSDTESRQA